MKSPSGLTDNFDFGPKLHSSPSNGLCWCLRSLNHPSPLIKRRRPDTVLSRCQNSLWIQSILDLLIEFQVYAVVEIVYSGDLVHDKIGGTVFSPAVSGTASDEAFEEPESAALVAVEYDADNVIWMSGSL